MPAKPFGGKTSLLILFQTVTMVKTLIIKTSRSFQVHAADFPLQDAQQRCRRAGCQPITQITLLHQRYSCAA